MTFRTQSLVARAHDLTHGPVGLWQLDGDLLDSSGNGFDLGVEFGFARRAPLPGGKISGVMFDGSTALVYSVSEASLRITGNMTVECLVEWNNTAPGMATNANARIVSHTGAGPSDNEIDNQLYSFGPSPTPGYRYFAETGPLGTNILYDTSNATSPMGLMHLAMTRDEGVIRYYVNAQQIGTSAVLATPSGGSNGRFRIGANDGLTVPILAVVASVKLLSSALTAQQIADEYGRTLG